MRHIPQAIYSSMRFVFLYADKYVFDKNWLYTEPQTPYSLLRYITKGNAIFEYNNKVYNVNDNEVIYIPKGVKLKCYSISDEFSFYSIRFINTLDINNNDFLQEYFSVPVKTLDFEKEILYCFKNIYEAAITNKINKFFTIRGHFELIISFLVDKANINNHINNETDTNYETLSFEKIYEKKYGATTIDPINKTDPRIQVAVNYIITHPLMKFNETSLCRLSGLSYSSFRRLFKKQTGKSPIEFTNELKMLGASKLLLTTNMLISIIAENLGYEDPNYFSKIFKKQFGVSPMKYRNNSRFFIKNINVDKKSLTRKGQLT